MRSPVSHPPAAHGLPEIHPHWSATSMLGAVAQPRAAADLRSAIERYRAAAATFLAAVDRLEEAQDAHREMFPHPLSVECLLGVPFLLHDEDEIRKNISAEFSYRRGNVAAISRFSPQLARELDALLDAKLAENMGLLDEAVAREASRQETSGLAQATRDYDAAIDAERKAISELCAFPCATLGDARAKAEYMLATPALIEALDREDIETLLRSFIPGSSTSQGMGGTNG